MSTYTLVCRSSQCEVRIVLRGVCGTRFLREALAWPVSTTTPLMASTLQLHVLMYVELRPINSNFMVIVCLRLISVVTLKEWKGVDSEKTTELQKLAERNAETLLESWDSENVSVIEIYFRGMEKPSDLKIKRL